MDTIAVRLLVCPLFVISHPGNIKCNMKMGTDCIVVLHCETWPQHHDLVIILLSLLILGDTTLQCQYIVFDGRPRAGRLGEGTSLIVPMLQQSGWAREPAPFFNGTAVRLG